MRRDNWQEKSSWRVQVYFLLYITSLAFVFICSWKCSDHDGFSSFRFHLYILSYIMLLEEKSNIFSERTSSKLITVISEEACINRYYMVGVFVSNIRIQTKGTHATLENHGFNCITWRKASKTVTERNIWSDTTVNVIGIDCQCSSE